jgi:hypothetical protein
MAQKALEAAETLVDVFDVRFGTITIQVGDRAPVRLIVEERYTPREVVEFEERDS